MEQDNETLPPDASAVDQQEEPAKVYQPPPGYDPLVQQATTYLQPVLQTMFNGVMLSSSQWCPADKMLVTLCRAFGTVVGSATAAGGLSMALRIRHACLEAFTEGVRSVKPQPPPTAAPPGAFSQMNGTSHASLMKGQIKR